MPSDSIKSRARSGVLWGGASQIAGLGLQLLQSVIAARILGPEKYAEIAVLYVVSSLALPLAQSGLGVSIIYLQERDPKRIAQVQGFSILISTAIASLIYLAAEPIAAYFRLEEASMIVKVSAVTVWFSGVASVWMSQLKRDLIFRDIEIAYLVSYTLGFVLVTVGLLNGLGTVSVVLGQACAAGLNALFLLLALHARRIACGIALPGPAVISHLKTGGINTSSAVLAIVSERIDAMLIGGRLSATDFGSYGLFARIVTALSTPIQRVRVSVELSSYAQLMSERDRLRRMFAKALGVSALVVSPVFIGLACVADLGLHVALGTAWDDMSGVFAVMCVFGLMRIISSSSTPLFMAAGLVRRALWIVLARLAILPPLLIATLTAFPSVMAVALVMTAAQAVQIVANYSIFIRPVLGPCAGAIANALGRPLAASVIMAAAVLGLRRIIPSTTPEAIELAVSAVAGAAVYVGATFLFNRDGVRTCAYMLSPVLSTLTGVRALRRKPS